MACYALLLSIIKRITGRPSARPECPEHYGESMKMAVLCVIPFAITSWSVCRHWLKWCEKRSGRTSNQQRMEAKTIAEIFLTWGLIMEVASSAGCIFSSCLAFNVAAIAAWLHRLSLSSNHPELYRIPCWRRRLPNYNEAYCVINYCIKRAVMIKWSTYASWVTE